MGKNNRGRRNGNQRQQPPQNLPHLGSLTGGTGSDGGSNFQGTTGRDRRIRTYLEREHTAARTYHSGRNNSYLGDLFAKLQDAVDDETLDFDSILHDIDQLLATVVDSVGRQSTTLFARSADQDYGGSISPGSESTCSGHGGSTGYRRHGGSGINLASLGAPRPLRVGGRRQEGRSPARSTTDDDEPPSSRGVRNPRTWAGLLSNHANRPLYRASFPVRPVPNMRVPPRTSEARILPRVRVSNVLHSMENLDDRRSRLQEDPQSDEPRSPQQPLFSLLATSTTSDSGSEAPTESLDVKGLAENASILLELFSRSHDDGDEAESRQLIESAFKRISKIRRYYKLKASQSGNSREPPGEQSNDVKIDSGCIICYTEVADTLLVPCNHLVLCAVCTHPFFSVLVASTNWGNASHAVILWE